MDYQETGFIKVTDSITRAEAVELANSKIVIARANTPSRERQNYRTYILGYSDGYEYGWVLT